MDTPIRMSATALCVAATIAMFSGPAAALAVTRTWDGGQTTGPPGQRGRWSNANNWDGDTLPAFDGTEDIVFASGFLNGVTATQLDGNRSIRRLIINTGTNFSIGTPGALTLYSGEITRTGSGTATITANLVLGGGTYSGIWSNANTTGALVSAGTISESGGARPLTIKGGGTVILSGVNTYSGGTIVAGGTLLVNNTSGSGTGSGAVVVESGGRLGGTGSVAGAVTVKDGGTLAPGFSVGTLSLGSLTLSASSTLEVELASLTSFDKLTLAGSATLGGHLQVILLGAYTPNPGDSFTIITAGGGVSGAFASVTPGFEVQISGNNVVLTVVPEPGTLSLVAAGIVLLVLLRGRRATANWRWQKL